MKRAEVVAAKRRLKAARIELRRHLPSGDNDHRNISISRRLQKEIAELERKLVQEGTQGWR